MEIWSTFLKIFLIFSLTASAAPPKNNTLVLLHVLFRHGNRTPDNISSFPGSLNANETYPPFGHSQLTSKGKKTAYDIGKYIRKNYDFIPRQYTPDVVKALTTNFKRTKMSLELVLAALFPPLKSDLFTIEEKSWQPIPFDVESEERLIGLPDLNCVNYVHAYYRYFISEEAQKVVGGYKSLYQELSKNSGIEVLSPRNVLSIYMTLKSEEDFGLKLPIWTRKIYPKVLEEAAAVDYEFATATPKLRKLSAGRLLKKILDDSFAKSKGLSNEDTKIFLYSAHELNIASMLRVLNVFERHVPPFGATIFFEIHNVGQEYGLKLYYQDYSQKKPKLLTIPGCSSFCNLEEVYKLVNDSLPGSRDVCTFTGELI